MHRTAEAISGSSRFRGIAMSATACTLRCRVLGGLSTACLVLLSFGPPAQAPRQLLTNQAEANKQPRTRGSTVDVDARWSEAGGYRPVRVTIAPSEPLDVERQFTVVLRSGARGYQGSSSITVEKRVLIPAVEDLQTAPPPTE